MNTDTPPSVPMSPASSHLTSSPSLVEVVRLFLPRWRWFAASAAVCVAGAWLWLESTPPQYTRTASILVKNDDRPGGGNSADAVDLAALTGLQPSGGVDNDLFLLRSPDLMEAVVAELGLADSYTARDGLRTADLYGRTPVLVTPADTSSRRACGFTVRLTGGGGFELSDFTREGEEIAAAPVSGRLGRTVTTPAGRFVLTRAPWHGAAVGELRYTRSDARAVAEDLAARLTASTASKQGSVITLGLSDVSPQRAEDVLSALVRAYNDQWIADRNRTARAASRFIGERLAVIESELGHVDTDISSYKSAHLLPDVQAASALYLSESAETRKRVSELTTRLSTAEYIHRELLSSSISEPLPVLSDLDGSGMEDRLSEYNALVFERNRLLSTTTETQSSVREKAAMLQAMRRGILRSLENYRASLETELAGVRRQEGEARSQLAASPGQAKYLLSVERQQKVKEALYVYLLQKREENELTQASTAYNARMVARPAGANSPTSPKRGTILAAALLLGLALPAGAVWALACLDTRVRSRKDVEGLPFPLIGEIPEASGAQRRSLVLRVLMPLRPRRRDIRAAVAVEAGRADGLNEAFRVARANLEFACPAPADGGARVVAVTSFEPGCGKTFASLNLTAALALKGRRVLLVDTDLRCAAASAAAGSPRPGLSDLLGGYAGDAPSLALDGVAGLPEGAALLPVGTLPPNPAELLEGQRFGELLEELRPHYDYILLDCPPAEMLADTQAAARHATRTLFVARVGLTARAALSGLEELTRNGKYPGLCLLLNGTEEGGGGYGRYGYKYGYGKKK